MPTGAILGRPEERLPVPSVVRFYVGKPRRPCLCLSTWCGDSNFGVIPGRREAASPESITTDRGLWIPGSLAMLGTRNDGYKCL